MTTRREFLQSLTGFGAIATLGTGCRTSPEAARQPRVWTVSGAISPDRMGLTLPHEHVLVDFIGAAQANRDRYDQDDVIRVALPHLQRVRELGCTTLIECTPAYLGRDPALLKRLAEASRLQILTNTGYYGAAANKFLPAHAWTETVEQLANRWIRESREGIEETGIRPGFIKIGVEAGPLSDLHRKLIRAAARTHWATGLTIAAHTGDGQAAHEELDELEKEGLAGTAFIWVHAQNAPGSELHLRAAERGAWVEFDGLNPRNVPQYVGFIQAMRQRGFLERVLVSHDAGWYHVGEPGGGQFRPFDTLLARLIPALQEGGFTDDEIAQLTVRNPAHAFGIRVRAR